MKPVLPELSTPATQPAIGRWLTGVDNSAPSPTRPESTYLSGNSVQTNRATSLDRFIPWTVPGRYYAGAIMVLLVVLNKVGPGMLLFAAIDIAAATWTWVALRSAK